MSSHRPIGSPDALMLLFANVIPALLARWRDADQLTVSSNGLNGSLMLGVVGGVCDLVERSPASGERPAVSRRLDGVARGWAREGGDLASLFEAVRLAQDSIWREFERVAEETVVDAQERWSLACNARSCLASWLDVCSEQVRRAFDAERRTALLECRERRYREVRGVLAGEPVCDLRLEYEFSATHVAVIAWDEGAVERLEAMAALCERRLLPVHSPDGVVWGWLGGGASQAGEALAELVRWQQGQLGGAAFGEPAAGLRGFRGSHGQALEAHRVALATGSSSVRFEAADLLAFAAEDAGRAARFVEFEIGPLMALGTRSAELLATLEVFLEQGQRVADTGVVRGLHRDTVRSQLDEIEKLLARRIRDRSVELLLALRWRALTPSGSR
jgi:hypothetical protein